MKTSNWKMLLESKADEQKLVDFAGKDLAQQFFKLKSRLQAPENDLYYWIKKGDPKELEDRLNQLLNTTTRKEKDIEASEGAELIYNKDGWKVYHITTYPASVKYGKGTKWCISGSKVWSNGEKGEEYFNDYTDKGIKFYFYIKDNEEKYALAYANDNTYQVFNAADEDVTSTVELPNVEGLPAFEFIYDWVYDGTRKAPERVRTVIIKDGVKRIEFEAFEHYVYLTNITIPNSVISIGDYAFNSCINIGSITIPNSVTSIGNNAFSECISLENIIIPNSVTSIGWSAFRGCKNLKNITISNSVKSIGYHTFAYCTNIESISIPNSVTSIGKRTFIYCRSLTNITIPNSVTSIGDEAFYNCPNLTITCSKGSHAEKYANRYNITVKITK